MSYFGLTKDTNNNAKVTNATKLAGEDLTTDIMKIEQQYVYQYISTATTTQVKTGAGMLHSIIIGETAAGAISIIDNTAGTTVNIGQLKSSIAEGTYIFNCKFESGLRIVTAAASKITVVYR